MKINIVRLYFTIKMHDYVIKAMEYDGCKN